MRVLSDKEFNRQTDMLDKAKYKCKCGHRVIIPKWVDKQVCSWCGNYVFKSKQDEFKYKMQNKLKGADKE